MRARRTLAGAPSAPPAIKDYGSGDGSVGQRKERMTDTSLNELGPVDYVVVEFPAGASNFTGEMATELLALVDSGTIRVIDILILTKNEDGTVEAHELSDVGELGELQSNRGPTGGALGRGRRRAPRRCDGAGKHCRSAHLGEPLGCAIRIGGAAFGRPTDRQRTDPHSGDHRLHRGRSSSCNRRRVNHATQTSTRWKSWCHRRAGSEDRGRGRGRHAGPVAGGEDRGRGRGRHTWAWGSPANLARRFIRPTSGERGVVRRQTPG